MAENTNESQVGQSPKPAQVSKPAPEVAKAKKEDEKDPLGAAAEGVLGEQARVASGREWVNPGDGTPGGELILTEEQQKIADRPAERVGEGEPGGTSGVMLPIGESERGWSKEATARDPRVTAAVLDQMLDDHGMSARGGSSIQTIVPTDTVAGRRTTRGLLRRAQRRRDGTSSA